MPIAVDGGGFHAGLFLVLEIGEEAVEGAVGIEIELAGLVVAGDDDVAW